MAAGATGANDGGLGVTRGGAMTGAAMWAVFCIAATAVRGVRWDETYEHAQVLLGLVPYPAYHPLPQYLSGAFSGPLHLAALTMALGAGEYGFNFLRNALALLAAVLPAYLLSEAASGRRTLAHGAAALTLAGTLNGFGGSYPMGVWPGIFSNGLIGGGAALLCLWATATARRGAAAGLMGAMPAIHIGQIPALALTWAGAAAWDVRRRRGAGRAMAIGLACGLALTGATAAGMGLFGRGASIPSSPEAHAIWQNYTFRLDIHRRAMPPSGWQSMALAAAAGLCAAPLALRSGNRALTTLIGFTAATLAAIGAAWAIRAALGVNTPFWAIGWMPYRLVNHLPYVTLALIAAVLAMLPRERGLWVMAAALAFLLFRGALYPLDPDMYARYLQAPSFMYHLLCGSAAGATIGLAGGSRLWGWGAAALVVGAPLAIGHQYGAACGLSGIVAGAALSRSRVANAPSAPWPGRACAIAAAALTAALLWGQWRDREPLRTRAEIALRDYLAEHAPADAMIAAEPYAFLLQAKLGRPVFTETATASLMSYAPHLGPGIDAMYRDVYGFGFSPAAGESAAPWEDVWRTRSAAEWTALRRRYGIAYAFAPPGLALHLDAALTTEAGALYAIPPGP